MGASHPQLLSRPSGSSVEETCVCVIWGAYNEWVDYYKHLHMTWYIYITCMHMLL